MWISRLVYAGERTDRTREDLISPVPSYEELASVPTEYCLSYMLRIIVYVQ